MNAEGDAKWKIICIPCNSCGSIITIDVHIEYNARVFDEATEEKIEKSTKKFKKCLW